MPEWPEITVLSGEMNAGDDFTFYYNLGFGGADATDERREVRSLYSQAATDALEIFSSDVEAEGGGNLLLSQPHAERGRRRRRRRSIPRWSSWRAAVRAITTWPRSTSSITPCSTARATPRPRSTTRGSTRAGRVLQPIAAFATDRGAVRWSCLGTTRCGCTSRRSTSPSPRPTE